MGDERLTCIVGGCARPVVSRRRCAKHYRQLLAAVGAMHAPRDELPAQQWDTGIRECLCCQVRLPAAELRDAHACGQDKVVRSGVVDHYRLMVPPARPHPSGRDDPRFAPPGEPPRTELGRYCQHLIDTGAFIRTRKGAA